MNKNYKQKTNEQALDAFIKHKIHIDEMLSRLQSLSNDHFQIDPDSIHWGHVSNLEDIAMKLKEITDKAFKEGEYAP